jgi:hypothetical protein
VRRGLWFAAGASAGVYAAARARRFAEAFTADGVRDRWHGVRAGARVFAEEAAAGRAEKETELRDRLGLAPHGVPELGPSPLPRDSRVTALSGRPTGNLDHQHEQEGTH